MLLLELNDRVYYMANAEQPEYLKYGFVTDVTVWKSSKKGRSYLVFYDDGVVGQFRSDYDGDCLFKSTKPLAETKK